MVIRCDIMGMYSPEEYFKKLYPSAFEETNLDNIIYFVILFDLIMLTFYYYIQYEKRKYKNINEINCGEINDTYYIKVVKTMKNGWLAIKVNKHTMETTKLRSGELDKVIDYVNRNFDLSVEI